MATATKVNRVNGLDVDALRATIRAIEEDTAKGMVEFRVKSAWTGQTRSEATVDSYKIGGQTVKRSFRVAANGITLQKLEIETRGELDLRGFLGIDPKVRPGYESIQYTVRIKGNGTPEQFRKIHETVIKTSPNYFNVSQPIRLDAELVVE